MRRARRPLVVALTALVGGGLLAAAAPAVLRVAPDFELVPVAQAAHTGAPSRVTVVGSLQSELGCAGDWDPQCTGTGLSDVGGGAWRGAWTVPAGTWEYKAALNGSWDENYGAGAQPNGSNIGLSLGADASVRFYYSHATHWITDSVNSAIAVAPGSFQSELGCAGDWDPGCLRSWLQDPDGDGIHTFETTAIPAGSYEAKVALNESWDVNYGQGGVQNGPNIAFTVPNDGAKVTFRYDSDSHVLTILAGHRPDGNVEWDGLMHDSRDPLYRTPAGAVPAGTEVRLRLRTFHNDVTAVRARIFSVDANAQSVRAMQRAAANVSCYDPALAAERCDFWETVIPADHGADNLWYRFLVSDGGDNDFYADDSAALDGGVGRATEDLIDRSYALTIHEPDFDAPDWASSAVIYQIFPDRFRDGRRDNNPRTGDVRYDDPVLKLPWGTLPEGYCRNYADGATSCPWRFDTTPPASSPTKEQPRGRDYMGGDLRGVDQRLDELQALGVTAIYFNPIFDAGSNHSYDTQDFTRIDPYFGSQKDFENLVKHARERGIRLILDGVFNHLSSDSPFFDRYAHYPQVGACESVRSPWRDWFVFTDQAGGPCAGPNGPNTMAYESWFGFDSIPVLNKSNEQVQAYFVNGPNSITRRWLDAGIGGWRMDVSGDASFPADYWPEFKAAVESENPDALTISETWQKDSTLLRMIRGDRLDTTMNYRLRDAVLSLLAPGDFDPKGFAGSGIPLDPSTVGERLESIYEDYAPEAAYSLMNLLDSHDTERILWTLTPGAETRAEREGNAANVAEGKARVRLASLIQFAVPGAPTVYYGDEVGMTGDDDPDDRRTYPWADLGGAPDEALRAHYTSLAQLRTDVPALVSGDFRLLLADDEAGVLAFGRRTADAAAVVLVNRGTSDADVSVPLAGYVPDGVTFSRRLAIGADTTAAPVAVSAGSLDVTVPAMGGLVLATGSVDLQGPAAPRTLEVSGEGDGQVTLTWSSVEGAAGYHVYWSPLSGGGWIRATDTPTTATEFTVDGLENGRDHWFTVRAVDAAGNEGAPSAEVTGLPHAAIGWANVQWPPTLTHTISALNRTQVVYGQVWIDGATNEPGATPGLRAQLGFGPDGSNPDGNPAWQWVEAAFNVDAGNNDEFRASLQPEAVGTFDYAYRYTTTNGRDWVYADLDGIGNGYSPSQAGSLTVNPSGDSAAPAAPTGLAVVTASPAGIELSWNAVEGDTTLHGYEVRRADEAGGPYATVGFVSPGSETFVDTEIVEAEDYAYVVRTVDTSFNRSADSDEVLATAQLRTVEVTFNVTVPSSTATSGRPVYITGTLSRFDGDHPDWDSDAVAMTPTGDPNEWSITLSALETTQIEYKYTNGGSNFDYVEKGAECEEIGNRQLTLTWGTDGTQVVNDTVLNWRNVAPCGN